MRRTTLIVSTLLALASCLQAQTFTCDVDQLWYSCDPATREATVIACKNAQTDYVYEQANIYIPATINVGGASFGGGSGSESENVYTVTEIGESAFEGSWAQTLTFDTESKVRVIRRRGLYGIGIKTLVLPASLRVIEEQGLCIRSSQKAKSFISTLVLPAGLDSLGLGAVALNKLQKLRFLGMTPPKCAVAEGEARNPWTTDGNATPADIAVEYPEGCKDVYKEHAGIGDYFTAFAEPETPTGVEDTDAETLGARSSSPSTKTLLNGRVLIQRDGQTYTLLGNPL